MNTNMQQGSYFLDAENAAEMARLIKQARVMSDATGLLPPEPRIAPGKMARILDIGCGPGEWITAIAEASTLSESTSAAAARLNSLFAEVLRMGGHTFAPAGDFLGTPAVMPQLLAKAGWTEVRRAAHLIDGSYGEPAHGVLVDLRNIL